MRRGTIESGSRWALVTGAGSGIGRCYAARLAGLGYNVLMAGLAPERLERAAAEIRADHPRVEVRTLAIDLARREASQELFERTRAEGIDVDVLVNNAGMFSFCDILRTPDERIERIVLLHDP